MFPGRFAHFPFVDTRIVVFFPVQSECVPQAMQGDDILCQAKSGMGKTAVFVLATLHQITPVDGEVSGLVMCHVRELAWQIAKEYQRLGKHLNPALRVASFAGGSPIEADKKTLKGASAPVRFRCDFLFRTAFV